MRLGEAEAWKKCQDEGHITAAVIVRIGRWSSRGLKMRTRMRTEEGGVRIDEQFESDIVF